MGAVTVLISGGFAGAYEQLLPEFEQTRRIKVTTRSGSSQGVGPQTIAAQLARGVSADVVILSREGLGELIAATGLPPERMWILPEYPWAWPCRRGLRSRM
jgi:molybdate transport system substrate-binding protein